LRLKSSLSTKTGLAVLLLLVIAIVLPIAAGCGGASSPEQAVNDFYEAIEAGDWNAYLNAVLPDNVRRMTSSDEQEQKKQFEEADFEYSGLKYKTIYDKKDKDTAQVQLVAGEITGTNPSTNQKETTTIEEIKKSYDITPSITVKKFKGSWYVDVPMASADRQTQQQ
jgi:hypothetical protein